MFLANTSVWGQIYVNKEWVRETGLPDQLDWSASVLDATGDVVVVGNTLAGPNNPDLLITKYDRSGTMLWQQTHAGTANAQDYGAAVVADQNGTLYVAGVVTTTSGFLDVVLLKYTNSGSLVWSQTWAGGVGLADVVTAMVLDGTGNIYLAGSTYTTSTNPDYLVLKYAPSGALLWSATYDHVGLTDAATGITVSNEGYPIVTGGSAISANAWDYATIKLNPTNGAEESAIRVNVPGVGLDNALAFTRDDAGSLFITGFREVNGVKDMQTVKLNSDFTLGWVKDYDAEGLHDAGRSVDADNQGNVYVAGYSRKVNGGSDMVTAKYASDGTAVWIKHFKASNPVWNAEATKCAATNDGGVIVVGTVFDGTSTNFKTIKYSANGALEWTKDHDSLNGDDKALDLVVDTDGNVYVGGKTSNTYTTVKYAGYILANGELVDGDGHPFAKDNELLVTFHPRYVNTTKVDDKEWQWGNLDQIVDASIADSIGLLLGLPSGAGKQIKVFKVHRRMTTADSISTRRLGTTMRMPKVWATFLLHVDLGTDPVTTMNDLSGLDRYIEWAQFNFIYQPYATNDPLYEDHQFSLRPTTSFPDADINVEEAWAINSGSPDIRVGVVDEMVAYWHPDFETQPGQSKVIDGRSYYLNQPLELWGIQNEPNSAPHGTACAGIIGAVRNNETGIAGIAGGDAANGNYGCSLISLGVFQNENIGTTANIIAALTEGSTALGSGNSFGGHVLNNSYGQSGFDGNVFVDSQIRRACYQAFRNECVFVVAKGNGESINFPADFGNATPWSMIATGASGPNGSLMTVLNGGLPATGTTDVIAPGHPTLMATTYGFGTAYSWVSTDCIPIVDDDPAIYGCFRGSSAAAPHVSGVAALLLSEHRVENGYPNGLAPEDVKHILLRSATDIVGTPANYPAGPDNFNGYGRVNAGAALALASAPFKVLHSSAPTSTIGPVQGAMETITIQSNSGFNNLWGLVPGSYQVRPYTFFNSYTDALGPNTTVQPALPGSTEPYAWWGRHSSVEGLTFFQGNEDANWTFSLDEASNTLSVEAWTTFYQVVGGPSNGVWAPRDPFEPGFEVAMPYSVLLRDQITVDVEELEREPQVTVVPNPAHDQLHITWTDAMERITIHDALGKLIHTRNVLRGQQQLEIAVGSWTTGVYSIRLHGEKGAGSHRFIKH